MRTLFGPVVVLKEEPETIFRARAPQDKVFNG